MSSYDPSSLESVTTAARNEIFQNIGIPVTSPDAPRLPLEPATMPDSDDEEYDVDQPEYVYDPKNGFMWDRPRMTEEEAREYESKGGYVRPLYKNRRGVSENWDRMIMNARHLGFKPAPPDYPLSAAWRTIPCIGVAFIPLTPEEEATLLEEEQKKKIAELQAQAQAQSQSQSQSQPNSSHH